MEGEKTLPMIYARNSSGWELGRAMTGARWVGIVVRLFGMNVFIDSQIALRHELGHLRPE